MQEPREQQPSDEQQPYEDLAAPHREDAEAETGARFDESDEDERSPGEGWPESGWPEGEPMEGQQPTG